MVSATRTCPHCTFENRQGKRFCAGCAAPLAPICPVCNAENLADAKFCDECGSSLTPVADASSPARTISHTQKPVPIPPAMRPPHAHSPRAATTALSAPPEERRLVSVLFCDLVGFTPLSEHLDPEEVRDLQAEYFTVMAAQIERYSGTVEKYAGDAVLALFGVPVAHEDDAERAVLCAMDMQAAIHSVATTARSRWNLEPAIRIGVNTGDVLSGTWNASGRQDVAVTGDALNTAARLQAIAEPGEILVGTETMRLTRRRIRYGERRDVALKGKAGMVPVYPVLGLRERFGERWETSEQATPLIGRDREMVELLDAWVLAQAGEGQLVTLIGDAGVGKSRLIAEMIDKVAPNSAARVIRARCLSYGQQISLWLIADLLRSLFGIGEQDGLDEARIRLSTVLPGLMMRCDAGARAEAQDVLGEVLGLSPGNSVVEHAGAQIRRQALIRSLKVVLGELSVRTPTVLVLEDVHWVDQASEDVLKEILVDVPGLRMLALVAQRPGWIAPWSEWGWTERTTLRPLRDAEAARLAGAVLGGLPLSPDLETYVAERAGGNPFFVEEMLRALDETGALEERHGMTHLAPGSTGRLPSTLTEVLLARLDRLDGPVRSVVQVASVIGRTFAVRLLGQVMELDAVALESPLSALQGAEIAFPRRGSDVEYVFKHVSMREVAYNTLVQKRRQQLHLDTARAIATLYPADEYVEILAYHYARTGEGAEAAGWLERAGDRASSVYAMDTAVEHYGEARRRSELTEDQGALARLDEKMGQVLVTAGRYDQAIPLLERAVEIYRAGHDLEGAGRATATAGTAHASRGTAQDGLARVEPMVELLAWNGPSPALAALYLVMTQIFQTLGRYEEMLGAAERAAEISRAIGDDRFLAWAVERRGSSLTFLGRGRESMPVLEEALLLLERVGDLGRVRIAVGNLGEVHRLTGNLEVAKRYSERALSACERVGDPAYIAFALMNVSEIVLTLGQTQEAREYLERAAAVLDTLTSASAYAAYIPSMLGRILVQKGQWEEAKRQFEHALDLAERTKDRQVLEEIHISTAELEVLQGEPEAAIARLDPMSQRAGGSLVRIETVLAWAYLQHGSLERADQLGTDAVRRAHDTGEVLALVDALRVRGMVLNRQERGDEAQDTLRDALARARSLPYPYAEGRILTELGDLEGALAIFQRLGAAKDVERLEKAVQIDGGPATPETLTDRLLTLLTAGGAQFDVMEHEPVSTSEEAARVRGTPLEQGAKALVYRADRALVLVVVPAHMRVNTRAFKTTFEVKDLRMVSPEELYDLTGLEVGAVPPFGHLMNFPTYVDERLLGLPRISFNCGSRRMSIVMNPADYARLEQPVRGQFAEERKPQG